MTTPKVDDWVLWKWANGVAEGRVVAVSSERTEVVSKGKRIVRNGTVDNPALTIEHSSGATVLKLASEIEQISSSD